MNHSDFETLFVNLTGHQPFPWQNALYGQFVEGMVPHTVTLPTGLGKTSVIAVWLIAWANHPDRLPRRLVYVVNRRTVVDQTTNEVKRLRRNVDAIGINDLSISTLRGQFADNGEWYTDPTRPAVICGTVDMIGSRLLFSGYRIGFKSRPLHAGFLGQDALLVHDEAHLEPAFQKLVTDIVAEQQRERETGSDSPCPDLQVMALSATTRQGSDNAETSLKLEAEDRESPEINKRITATKAIHLHPCEEEKKQLASQLVTQALTHRESGDAVLVFARRVDDALDVFNQLEKEFPDNVAPLTGTMRGYERDRLVRDNPVFARFMPPGDRSKGITPTEGTVFLVCTSAGEVGVNLSADHMVCDLSTFESMAQRLGRVNRFGERDHTQIDVVHPELFDEKKDPLAKPRQATLALLNRLEGDASPKSLGDLMEALGKKERDAAFAPTPTIPRATDILFDAWAMTTIRGEMPGRPPVEPYLHGIEEWEPPRTSVAWREGVDVIGRVLIERHGDHFPQSLLEDYPLKPHELLNDTTERVYKALTERAKHIETDVPVWLVSQRGDVIVESAETLLAAEKKQVVARLSGCTILLPPSFGGIAKGMLDGKVGHADDVADAWYVDGQQRRIRLWEDESPPAGMALVRTIDTDPERDEVTLPEQQSESEAEETPRKKRFWQWYVRPADAENATPASIRPVTWQDHTDAVVRRATEIVTDLDLPEDLQQAVILAAELHDLGKQRELWQRSIGNPNPADWYAKPGKPTDGPRWRPRHITDYRHEFGSLLDALDVQQPHRDRLNAMNDGLRDLILHLVATHHGYARPHFPPKCAIDPNYQQSVSDEVTVEVMRRYARLQRRYGRWGLAYLESLLRIADWAASAKPTLTEAPDTLQEATA